MSEKKLNKPIYIHQVNCKGVMGAGFAKYVKETYQTCYFEYRKLCLKHKTNSKELLGSIQVFENKDIIINMFSQDGYGRDKRYTDYKAMEKCLIKVRENFPTEKIIAPKYIGCGLAGGNWEIVENLLKKYNIDYCENIILKKD